MATETSTSTSTSTTTSTTTTTATMPPLERTPPRRMVLLNRSGDVQDNPILAGLRFRVKLHKHGDESLRRCWVTRDGSVFKDLTARCVETETQVYVDVVAGTDLEADFPALLNRINFTTSDEVHHSFGVWIADVPPHVVLLDGYDGQDPDHPIVVPFVWSTV